MNTEYGKRKPGKELQTILTIGVIISLGLVLVITLVVLALRDGDSEPKPPTPQSVIVIPKETDIEAIKMQLVKSTSGDIEAVKIYLSNTPFKAEVKVIGPMEDQIPGNVLKTQGEKISTIWWIPFHTKDLQSPGRYVVHVVIGTFSKQFDFTVKGE